MSLGIYSKAKLQSVIEQIKVAQQLNDEIQATFQHGSLEWHKCETIDDRLFEALTELGD